jgi:hypothetical protein
MSQGAELYAEQEGECEDLAKDDDNNECSCSSGATRQHAVDDWHQRVDTE